MRILLAIDGSQRAALARDLVASIDWPNGSTVRVVTALETASVLFGTPWAPPAGIQVDRLEDELRTQAEGLLEEAARVLAHTGCSIERELLRGRPASAVIERADTWKSDVVVMGSRGHGRIGSMLLGSVTAEVADHARCPVLVARAAVLTRVVMAHDGSSFALAGEALLTGWPIFAKTAIEVVSVAPGAGAWRSGLPVAMSAERLEGIGVAEAELREHRAIASDAEARLRAAGLRASSVVARGDPAEGIMRVAEGSQADMIVLGSHGRTGLTRALLGSVARNVMLHASCSVLLVRQPPGEMASSGPDT